MAQSSSTTRTADTARTPDTGRGEVSSLVTELIGALRAVRPGTGEVTTFQQAIIEEHAELKRLLRGPDLVSPGPAITKVEPLSGTPGVPVKITGERLADTTLVRIGAGRIDFFQSRSDTEISLNLPQTATTGEVIVFSPLGVAASGITFTVQPVQPQTAATRSR